jgi:site-specific DNA recombinase
MRDALIDKSEFEPRITRLKERVAHLETQVQAVGQAVEQQRELRLVIGQLADFAATVRDRLDHLEWETCQAILRALVKRVEIDHDQVQVIFRIGPCPLPPELSTPVSQDCERRGTVSGGETTNRPGPTERRIQRVAWAPP